jgi:hypothetical protein
VQLGLRAMHGRATAQLRAMTLLRAGMGVCVVGGGEWGVKRAQGPQQINRAA